MSKVTSQHNLSAANLTLAQEWHSSKNGELTPSHVAPCSHKKVWWQCKKGHEWESLISNRQGLDHGCPYCGGNKVCEDNCLTMLKPRLAEEWHPTKNGKLTPNDVTPGSGRKVWWQCKKRHEWQAPPCRRVSMGTNCPFCSGRKVCRDNCLAKLNPKLAQQWHSQKNGKLTPNDVTLGSTKKVWWLCKKGHEWQVDIKNRGNGSGCPYCSGAKACKDNCLATKNPKLVKEWHPVKNGTLTPYDVMPESHRKVWWQCTKGHAWQAAPNNRGRLHVGECPYCNGNKVCKDNCLATRKPKLAEEWHPTKNEKLTPEDVTIGSGRKVWWLCKKGHEWMTTLNSRTSMSSGCPFCNSQTSVMELKIYAELKCIFLDTKLREKINKVECDIYIPSLRLGIEYDGVYWHKNKNEKDRSKNSCLEKNGVKLIRVRELGLDKISELDVIYDLKKKKDKLLIDKLLKRIERISTLSATDQARVDSYFKKASLVNNEEFINLLDRLPSPPPGSTFADLKPKLLKEWHPKKNGKLTPWDVTPWSSKKVWWRCDRDHEWEAVVGSRSKGYRCPYCVGKYASKENCLATARPKLSKEWHSVKNGILTPKDVTPGSHKKVWWVCEKQHEWKAVVKSRSKGHGCPYCSRKRAASEKGQLRFDLQ